MVFFFERGATMLELETRYDNDTREYVLVMRLPEGAATTERFGDALTFRTRLQAIEDRLRADHWQRHGAALVLPDGWPDRTPQR